MRNIKTLLELLRDELPSRMRSGMCACICDMLMDGTISDGEWVIINTYFNENGISMTKYQFTKGELQPRLDWLNEQINKLP